MKPVSLASTRAAEALSVFFKRVRALEEHHSPKTLRRIARRPPEIPGAEAVPGGYRVEVGGEDLFVTPATLSRLAIPAQRAIGKRIRVHLDAPYAGIEAETSRRLELLERVLEAALRFWESELGR